MMKKKNFFTGSVFQFYVPEIKKYAFCKLFDFKHISNFHGVLIQVFDRFSDTSENTVDDLKFSDWLFGARSINALPNLKKDSGWKSLGILTAVNDEVIPDFKDAQVVISVVENESEVGPWFPIHGLTRRGSNCEYSQIRHLERMILTTTSGIETRTGMEYCRINGLNIKDYYDLEDEGIRKMYWQMINIPVYKTIPLEIRGKALVSSGKI